jgi:hypothetical protein
MAFEKYGVEWQDGTDLLGIEFLMIQKGGKFDHNGKQVGEGLFHHYKAAEQIVWPDEYHNRWTDLILTEILNNTITAIQGPKDTGKTRRCSKYSLIDYWAFPNDTLFLISSTTMPALEARVWGDIKSLFRRATSRFPWLAGHVLESKHAIVTDDLDIVDVRDMRKGIMCVPCKNAEGEHLSIASYVGIKQKRRRHIGDEFQFMSAGMLESIGNMNSGDYKGIFPGNPIGQDDPLDQITEPDCGWEDHPEPATTTVWKNKRFLNSRTICLYGPDSPAIQEEDGTRKYPGLLNQDSIDRVIAGYGLHSHQYYSQCLGVRKPGINAKRVITAEFCKKFKVQEKPIWDGTPRTKIFALDAAYGGSGGDRCVGGHGEFGRTVDGIIALQLHEPQTVHINLSLDVLPEYQIANWVKKYIDREGIPVANVFYDSTGRGSLGPPLAQVVGVMINAVEFGGNPSNRPVTLDHKVLDKKTQKMRLKLCVEHYRKFVSELWWTMRLAIESGQAKGLNQATIDEGAKREWKETDGNKIEVEAKDEMKKRTGYSPDLFDWAVTVLEGARRRGFQIRRMANEEETATNRDWISKLVQNAKRLRQSQSLNYAA